MGNVIRHILDRMARPASDPVPPQKLIRWVGPGDFVGQGQEFLRYFIELGGLKPHHRVLDVGCGCGRMALPLTKYISDEGGYEGFDVIPDLVRWCQRNITPRHPNFHFRQADIYNKVYNPRGKHAAREYQFPYDSESFDFVALASVFTHMLPEDMEHYFCEIARVTKPGGRSVMTYFLLNDESRGLMAQGASSLDFKHKRHGCMTAYGDKPESAVAYDEKVVRELYSRHGFQVVEPIRYGSWSGRKEALSFQDLVVAVRSNREPRAAAPKGGGADAT